MFYASSNLISIQREGPYSYDVFKSISWSWDGQYAFVMLHNASIMRMPADLSSPDKSVKGLWSVPREGEPVYCEQGRKMCVTLPQASVQDERAITHICTLSVCSPDKAALLLRVLANGERLKVKKESNQNGPAHQVPGTVYLALPWL
jgi:hypothetical protein